MTTKQYIPALRFPALTRFYDRLLAATLPEDRIKRLLVAQLGPRPGQRILDLGCGTGTLTLLLKQVCPQADVLGLDADGDALQIARLKSEAADARIRFCQSHALWPGDRPAGREGEATRSAGPPWDRLGKRVGRG